MYANKVKKVVAVHDLSGVGRVSLTVVIPILSSMGFQVCPLPTAVLSSHTQYPNFSFLDLTDEMPKIISEWKKLGVQFDAFYTGYLGSPLQIQIVTDFIDDFRQSESLVVVDPVLGDNGKLYANFHDSMIKEMRQLVTKADVITPNLTELFYLLDLPYKEQNTDEELKSYLRQLSDKGPEVVIITSVPVLNDIHKTSVYAYNRTGNRFWKVTCPYLPAHYPGTGDTFTSVSPGLCCKVTAFLLHLTVLHSLFYKEFALLSVMSMITVKVFFWRKCCIISICLFRVAVMSLSDHSYFLPGCICS